MFPMNSRDEFYMKEALRLAVKGRGRTSPNPMVGAVVLQGNTLVGRGFHAMAGGPHAEVNALRAAGAAARGGTLYVTLEPCNHQGRTPPCTRAVLDAGITRVVVGMGDPNPSVKGGGSKFLQSHGLRVDTGILEEECRSINQAFIKHVTTGLPYVTLKVAATLDGRIATRCGDSQWISNERSRRFVHQLRCHLDAILVGIDTALRDDPLLTARIRSRPECRQPVRIIADSRLKLPLESQLVKTARENPVWVACTEGASREQEKALSDAGVEIIRLPDKNGQVDLLSLLREAGKRQITSLLVEGGARIHGAFLEERLADAFHFFYAPKILGDAQSVPMIQGGPREHMSDSLSVYALAVRRFGQDIMLSGRFHERLY